MTKTSSLALALMICWWPNAPVLADAVPSTAAAVNPQDPFERTNRRIFTFNQWVDHHAIRPVAKTYHAVVPEPVRGAIGGVLAELTYPSVIVNDLLQGSGHVFVRDTARFVINGTVGLAGLWDPATPLGLMSHETDFGQTLAKYGVPPGPYLMLPILGPDVLRDLPSEVVDRYDSIDWHLKKSTTRWEISAVRLISRRDELLPADAAVDNAFDPYRSVREAYLQKRAYHLNGPESDDDDLPPLDDTEP